ELIRQELLGEATGEGHEVVGGDGSGDDDGHAPDSRRPGPINDQAGSSVEQDSVERVTAGAGARRPGVVDGEALLLDGVDEVDRRAGEVRDAHAVHGELDPAEVVDDVAVERAVVEEQLVAQARATTGLDGDAQREIVTALLVEEGLGLGGGGVGELDTGGGGVLRSGHDCSPCDPREGVGGVSRGATSPLHPSIPLSRYALCGTWVDSRPARRSPSLRE